MHKSPASPSASYRNSISSVLLLSAVLFLLSGTALGFGFHDALSYGNSIDVISVRAAGLVGARVFGADGPSAIFLNPAGLKNISSLGVSASTSYLSWTEEVQDSTSTVQRSDRGLGSLTGSFAVRTGSSLVLGAGVAKVSDFQYDGTHFLPEDPSHPDIDIIETLKSSGGLWEALGGVSWDVNENLTVGASGGLRFGEVSYDYTLDKKFTPDVDSSSTWSWDLSEPCYHAGFTIGDDILAAGASYTSGTEDRYYSRLAIAGMARAEHIGNTNVSFEGDIIDPFGENYFNGKLSLETPIRSNFSLLAGVGFNEGPKKKRVGMNFSVGGTYTASNIRVEFALFSVNRSRLSSSFPAEFSDYVDDSWTHFCFGLQYTI